MITYDKFLEAKRINDVGTKLEVSPDNLNPMLFDFQRDIALWSLRKGRVLVGANCGLGKGLIDLEFLTQVYQHLKEPVIMFCPPGVKIQFKYEAAKFNYGNIHIVSEDVDIKPGINITNYERLMVKEQIPISEWRAYKAGYKVYQPIEQKRDDQTVWVERFRFNPNQFGGIVLDEASCLKHFDAKTRKRLTRFARNIDFRLCATATPAPNDLIELSSYVEFFGIMNSQQMKAMYFIQDGNNSNKYRIKKPAWKPFWEFVASWAVIMEKPSDLGYDDNGFVLPELITNVHIIDSWDGTDFTIPELAKTLGEQAKTKRETVEERCKKAAELVKQHPNDHWLIYCKRNDEGELLNKLIPNSVEVAGRHDEETKEERLIGFAQGKYQILITKPRIGGFGLNLQEHCNRVITVSVEHSYEEMYQYIRRVWRFGQTKKVYHEIIAMDVEADILINQQRKEEQNRLMYDEIRRQMNIHELNTKQIQHSEMDYVEDDYHTDYWSLYLGDSAVRISQELDDQSVDCVVTSVPFPAMYAYTNSERDIGNYETVEDLLEHLKYVFIALLPKMTPGRICHIHISQGVSFKEKHGVVGLMDFRGPLIKMMTDNGWIYHADVTIEKDPVLEQNRNKTMGLLQKTASSDASKLRHSVPDYLLQFRAPGESAKPFSNLLADPNIMGNYKAPDGWMHLEMWQNWASCVWLDHRKGMKWWEGINRSRVVGAVDRNNARQGYGVIEGKGEDDERHLCELQLDVIERAIALHSNVGELVVDPFSGIGSTGFQAIKMGRRYKGFELKKSYHFTAIKNLRWIEFESDKGDMFDMLMSELEEEDTLTQRHKKWMSERGISMQDRATEWSEWEDEIEAAGD